MSIELRSKSHDSTEKLLAFIKQECNLSDDDMVAVKEILENHGYIAIRDKKVVKIEKV